MNKNGSGVTHVKHSMSDELKLFNGGIRQVPLNQHRLEMGRSYIDDAHDNFDYVRGTVIHSRSPVVKYHDFHGFYGGMFRDITQRFLYQHLYKRIIRPIWFPCSLVFIYQCIGMRKYDNKAYDYYYFSD